LFERHGQGGRAGQGDHSVAGTDACHAGEMLQRFDGRLSAEGGHVADVTALRVAFPLEVDVGLADDKVPHVRALVCRHLAYLLLLRPYRLPSATFGHTTWLTGG